MALRNVEFDGESLITPALLADHAPPQADADQTLRSAAADHMRLALGFALQRFRGGDRPAYAVESVLHELHRMRMRYDPTTWAGLVPLGQDHPLTAVIREDPFTDWSFRKPRGYSGDAHLLDFIYAHPATADEVAASTPLGRAIHDYTMEAASSVAVRERRQILADLVDRTAERVAAPEILTVAAGHLREATISKASQAGRVKRWVALDQDPESIATIAEACAGTCVEPLEGSVRGLLQDAYDIGTFDLVYAAGLYDYLPRAVAIKLTRKCLSRLRPGGTFLFANFARGMVDDAYREIFMNWELILRSEDEMWDIVNASVDRNRVDVELRRGENGMILYGLVHRRD